MLNRSFRVSGKELFSKKKIIHTIYQENIIADKWTAFIPNKIFNHPLHLILAVMTLFIILLSIPFSFHENNQQLPTIMFACSLVFSVFSIGIIYFSFIHDKYNGFTVRGLETNFDQEEYDLVDKHFPEESGNWLEAVMDCSRNKENYNAYNFALNLLELAEKREEKNYTISLEENNDKWLSAKENTAIMLELENDNTI